MQDLDFETLSAQEVILKVAAYGSPVQRGALARHLSPEIGLYFPSIVDLANKNGGQMKVLSFIQDSIKMLSDHFGVSFSGNIDSVAFSIYQDYGGLSIADFLIFFERAKSGEYKQEFQHVAARGINYDFLKSWLDQYTEQREAARAAIHSQYKDPKKEIGAETDNTDLIERFRLKNEREAEIRNQRIQLEQQADVFRANWEAELFETQLVKQWYKNIKVAIPDAENQNRIVTKSQQVFCTPEDSERVGFEEYPIQVHKPGAVQRLVKRVIFDYVAFGDAAETNRLFDDLLRIIEKRYKGELAPVDAELKAILAAVTNYRRQITVRELLETQIQEMHPNAPQKQVAYTATLTIRDFEILYFKEYLPECIQFEYPALLFREFIWQHVLAFYVKSGKENPITKIIFG